VRVATCLIHQRAHAASFIPIQLLLPSMLELF